MPEVLLKTTHVEETAGGDLNNLEIFLAWLKLFHSTNLKLTTDQSRSLPLILLVTSYLYRLLFKSPAASSSSVRKELTDFCRQNSIFVLFYPTDTPADALNQSLFLSFKDTWRQTLLTWSTKDSPNSQKAFLFMVKQTLRLVYNSRHLTAGNPMKDCLTELFTRFKLDSIQGYSIDRLETSRRALYRAAVTAGFVIDTDPSSGKFQLLSVFLRLKKAPNFYFDS